MDRKARPIDEYTLAAYLSGTLSAEQRREVAAYLANHADARELLCMAYQALEESGEACYTPVPERSDETAVKKGLLRQVVLRPKLHVRRLARFSAAAVIIFTVGLGLRLSAGPPIDTVRSGSPSDTIELVVNASQEVLRFEWSPVEGAYQYRVVVWDPLQAAIVTAETVQSTRLSRESDFISKLDSKLVQGRTYQFRVDAVDAQNRLIRSSSPVDFNLKP